MAAKMTPGGIFAPKFFGRQRDLYDALALLDPRLDFSTARKRTAPELCDLIHKVGLALAANGSPLYTGPMEVSTDPEPPPPQESDDSLEQWKTACEDPTAQGFADILRKATENAEAALHLVYNMRARCAALRWYCCLLWIVHRAEAVAAKSVGGRPSPISEETIAEVDYKSKFAIIASLKELVEDPGIMTVFDNDLRGYGVWHHGGHEPLPEDARDEWVQRGTEMDISMLCRQVHALPPSDLNGAQPLLSLRQPYPYPSIKYPPWEAARKILEVQSWGVEMRRCQPYGLPAEILKQPFVLYASAPPDAPESETVKWRQERHEDRKERGREREKADVEGLSSSSEESCSSDEEEEEEAKPDNVSDEVWEYRVKRKLEQKEVEKQVKLEEREAAKARRAKEAIGSTALLYVTLCAVEDVENICFEPRLVTYRGFLGTFLQHGTNIRSLDISGAPLSIKKIRLLMLAPWLQQISLVDCSISEHHVMDLVEVLVHLAGSGQPGQLRSLNLSRNLLDGAAVANLVDLLTPLEPPHVILEVIRLDGNPVKQCTPQVLQELLDILDPPANTLVDGVDLVLSICSGVATLANHPGPGTKERKERVTPVRRMVNISQMADSLEKQVVAAKALALDQEAMKTEAGRNTLKKRNDIVARLRAHPALVMWEDDADSEPEQEEA